MEADLKFSFQILFIFLVLLGKMDFNVNISFFVLISSGLIKFTLRCTRYKPAKRVNIAFIITLGDVIFSITTLLRISFYINLYTGIASEQLLNHLCNVL